MEKKDYLKSFYLKDYSMIFGLTINNITNQNNLYASGNKQYSEIGRQFIADVSFKF